GEQGDARSACGVRPASPGAIRRRRGRSWAGVKFVGERLRRVEDRRLLTGEGRYVADIGLPGMLDAVVVRSPHAHARIRRIDVEGARKRPGVVDVVTFAELGSVGRPLPAGPAHAALRERNWLVLARDEVRFVGEAVVAVIARGR